MLASLLFSLLPVATPSARGDQAAPQFTCGVNALTYLSIPMEEGRLGVQVRCVIVDEKAPSSAKLSAPRMVWYGEGWDGMPNNTNRHLGVAFAQPQGSDLTGYAADISSDGAARNESFLGDIIVHVVHGSWPAPTVLDVTSPDCGCFHDRWTLVQSVPYTPMARLTACDNRYLPGYHFDWFTASYTSHHGSGLRCVFRVQSSLMAWIGDGTMDGTSYTQIGYRTPHNFAAVDLCGTSFGARCRAFAAGSVKLTERHVKKSASKTSSSKTQDQITVTYGGTGAAWTEHWVKK